MFRKGLNWGVFFTSVLAGLLPGAGLLLFVGWRMQIAEPGGQHAGAGEGALTVAHLLDRVEKERRQVAESTGRHALREDVAAKIAAIVGI
ncbi:hypothetical protein A8926_1253 [Saccharopolyspora spinosa]|uniref:Uncharacterized protein n=2 Tax=Saccharopolyspora spinosa TaxID=60894 RepID=A0A2N3XSU8_SACSN|nr:hypothetical protein A8926_1253 [Saccharopolyspora spinosa]